MVENRRFYPIQPVFGAAIGATAFEFHADLWKRRRTRVPDHSNGVVCVILRLAVLAYKPTCDGRTDGQTQARACAGKTSTASVEICPIWGEKQHGDLLWALGHEQRAVDVL